MLFEGFPLTLKVMAVPNSSKEYFLPNSPSSSFWRTSDGGYGSPLSFGWIPPLTPCRVLCFYKESVGDFHKLYSGSISHWIHNPWWSHANYANHVNVTQPKYAHNMILIAYITVTSPDPTTPWRVGIVGKIKAWGIRIPNARLRKYQIEISVIGLCTEAVSLTGQPI